MMPFRVICINDSDRPESIPTRSWVKVENIYTVVQVDRLHMQGGAIGYKLYEIDLDPYFPYQYFGAWRFAIIADDLENMEELDQIIEKLAEEALKKEVSLVEPA